MDFKSLGENSIVHIIRKKPYRYETGVLKSKSVKQQNPYQIQTTPQLFDLVITVNGNDEVVPNITDNMEVVEYKGCYYSASVEGILQANANMAQMAHNGKNEQAYYDSVLKVSEEVKEKLNPQYAEGRRQARTIEELVEHRKETDKKLDEILSFMRDLSGSPKK